MAPADLHRGTFIALEGIDGSGKTTIATRLAAAIRAAGVEVVLTREPGGTEVGEKIRDVLLAAGGDGMAPATEVLLFAAARAQHVTEVIRPALDRGAVVITDRFGDSTRAYQWGGRGICREAIESAQRIAAGDLVPDLKILFDLPVEVALRRRLRDAGQANRLDHESAEFHARVRAAYLALAAEEPARWRVVDASLAPEAVWTQVAEAVDASGALPVELGAERRGDATRSRS